jgi:hypothetical protein
MKRFLKNLYGTKRRPTTGRRPRPGVEALEDRRLMAGDLFNMADMLQEPIYEAEVSDMAAEAVLEPVDLIETPDMLDETVYEAEVSDPVEDTLSEPIDLTETPDMLEEPIYEDVLSDWHTTAWTSRTTPSTAKSPGQGPSSWRRPI